MTVIIIVILDAQVLFLWKHASKRLALSWTDKNWR